MKKEKTPVLKEEIHIAETIDEDRVYTKYKYRIIQRIGFYIRPLRVWYFPCKTCQEKLKTMMANGVWILGNDSYKPDIELNTTTDEVDEDYEETIEERKATPEEIERIGLGGWEEVKQ